MSECKKKKRHRDEREAMDMDGDGDGDGDRDRDLFDELPTHLIHTILSFLITTKEIRIPSQRFIDTKEATRTIMLSKTFLQAWSSFPDLYFTDLAFSKSLHCSSPTNANRIQASNERERFANYVLHTITTYQQHNIPIVSLHLTTNVQEEDDNLLRRRFDLTSPSKDGKIANILDQSIRKANEYGVKEIYLHMSHIRPSNFLQTIFATKQLISLILSWCDLVKKDVQEEDSDDILVNCSSLRVLKLEKVRINEAVLQKLIHSCPLIEEIQLHDCRGLQTIEMAHLPNLKRLEVSTLKQIVDVKAASLELLCVSSSSRLTIGSAWNLKILNLESVDLWDAHFHNLVANCCVLEELTLRNCDVIQKINVSSHSLSFLSITYCRYLMEVKIDAPILNMFEYYGERVLTPLSFASGGSEKRKSSVTIDWNDDDDEEQVQSFLELSVFLMALKHSDNISLDISSTEISFDRNIMDGLRDENNIPEFDEVDIKVSSPSSMYSTIMEGFLWSFSPKIISVKRDSKYDDEFIMYLCEELLVQYDDHPNISTSECWRNYFKQAKFKNKDRDDEWRPLHSWKNLTDVLKNLGDQYILKLSHA